MTRGVTRPLVLAALWRDTLADTRALLPLALPVAAAFVLLPGVAVELFGPPLPAPALAAPGTAATGTLGGPVARHAAPALPPVASNAVAVDLLLPSLIGLVAQLAVVRLALDRRRGVARSVGEALATAFRVWPFAVLAVLLGSVAVVPGLLLFVVPGLYIAGRLTPAVAFVVDGTGPVAALEASWALTAGNGWRTIGFTLIFAGWFVIVSFAAGAVGAGLAALLAAAGAGGAGAVVASALDGLVAALFTVVNAVAVATVYRTLKTA